MDRDRAMTPRRLSERIFAAPALRAQPDRRLVGLAREGSELAIEEIVRRYRPALLRFAASIVPVDRADDVVQDSLAQALPRIESGEQELHRERVRSLVAGLQGLPDAQRDALVKREMEGMSHAEIAADLGVSGGAARQLIFRARNALREGIGSLVPMPLLRHLAESGDGGGAVAVVARRGGRDAEGQEDSHRDRERENRGSNSGEGTSSGTEATPVTIPLKKTRAVPPAIPPIVAAGMAIEGARAPAGT